MHNAKYPTTRLRRLRQSPTLRRLLRETTLTVNDLVMPLFINANIATKKTIDSMPGQYQLSLNDLTEEVNEIEKLGIPAVILFGIPENKDATGSSAYGDKAIIPKAIQHIKEINSDLIVISDICCCEYTDHGHCGIMDDKQQLDNDATLEILAKQTISHAKAGADILAPSGNIDGMVTTIRKTLDNNNFENIPILSYAVKFQSSFYSPFRAASGDSSPKFGDRSTYQMDFANSEESLREVITDINEGADILMVKPTLYYLDIIYKIKQKHPEIPLAAYQVSGEYAMIKAAVLQGSLQEEKAIIESLTGIKRAGADFILSYFAKDAAKLL